MNWKSVRLELAGTGDFPAGSASRSYLLRLPLEEDGLINEAAIRSRPAEATVRRFWPNQADLSGRVVRTPSGWAFSYRIGEEDGEPVFHLETDPIRPGACVTVTEPDGRRLPFRVASVRHIS